MGDNISYQIIESGPNFYSDLLCIPAKEITNMRVPCTREATLPILSEKWGQGLSNGCMVIYMPTSPVDWLQDKAFTEAVAINERKYMLSVNEYKTKYLYSICICLP